MTIGCPVFSSSGRPDSRSHVMAEGRSDLDAQAGFSIICVLKLVLRAELVVCLTLNGHPALPPTSVLCKQSHSSRPSFLLSILFPPWPCTQQIHCDRSDHLLPTTPGWLSCFYVPLGFLFSFPEQFVHLRGL